jgi:ribosomal protein L24E
MSRSVLNAFLLIACSVGVLAAQDKPSANCDLLAKLQKKPKSLEFVSCSRHMELQGKPWMAIYRVDGTHAAEVEQFLVREFGMKKVTHTCCEWASTQNSYVHKDGRVFIFEMGSGETLINRKDQWSKIPYFNVEVELETEEP